MTQASVLIEPPERFVAGVQAPAAAVCMYAGELGPGLKELLAPPSLVGISPCSDIGQEELAALQCLLEILHAHVAIDWEIQFQITYEDPAFSRGSWHLVPVANLSVWRRCSRHGN